MRSGVFGKRDIDSALDAAHKVKDKWAHTSVQNCAAILFKIADPMEQNLELLATAKPGITANPFAKPVPPTCRWRLTIFATSPRVFGRRKWG
ncbi:aldehyde dehydrogenase family protein [Escherichia coli]